VKAKEYLMQLGLLEARINNMKAELDVLRHILQDMQGIDYTAPKVQVSPAGDVTGKNIARCLHLEQEIEDRTRKFIVLKHCITGQINSLDNAVFVKLLFMRYVEYRKLLEIAGILDYTYKHTRRLHGYALQDFAAHNREVLELAGEK